VSIDVEVRVAETDDELEAWRRVRMAVLPDERARTVDEMRAMALPETAYLIAHVGDELVEQQRRLMRIDDPINDGAGDVLGPQCPRHHGPDYSQ
jgi:hypothetical protein